MYSLDLATIHLKNNPLQLRCHLCDCKDHLLYSSLYPLYFSNGFLDIRSYLNKPFVIIGITSFRPKPRRCDSHFLCGKAELLLSCLHLEHIPFKCHKYYKQ